MSWHIFSLASYFLILQQNTHKMVISFPDCYGLGMRLMGEWSHVCVEQFTLDNVSPLTLQHRLCWIKVFSWAGLWVSTWIETEKQRYHIWSVLNYSLIFARWFLHHLESDFYLFAVCDPVMGDNGKMVSPRKCWQIVGDREPFVYSGCYFQYVSGELLQVYRDKLMPVSEMLTPNQFEAE